ARIATAVSTGRGDHCARSGSIMHSLSALVGELSPSTCGHSLWTTADRVSTRPVDGVLSPEPNHTDVVRPQTCPQVWTSSGTTSGVTVPTSCRHYVWAGQTWYSARLHRPVDRSRRHPVRGCPQAVSTSGWGQ